MHARSLPHPHPHPLYFFVFTPRPRRFVSSLARCVSCAHLQTPPARFNTHANKDEVVTLLDYGAGNVRSVRNAITKLGYTVKDVSTAADLASATKLVFPGVGAYGSAMEILKQRGLVEPLRDYVRAGKPFLGVCLGLQLLFDGSEESGGVEGLGETLVHTHARVNFFSHHPPAFCFSL